MDLFLTLLNEVSEELGLECEAKRGGLESKFVIKETGKVFYFIGNNLPINNIVSCKLSLDKVLCSDILITNDIHCVQHRLLPIEEISYLSSLAEIDLFIKPLRGKGGSNVYRVTDRRDLLYFKDYKYRTKIWCYSDTNYYNEEYRVTVLDKECVSIYGKTKSYNGQNNLSHGAEAFIVRECDHKELIELAIKTSNSLDLRFSNVDVFYDTDGNPKVMEVNSSVCLKKVLYSSSELYEQCKIAYIKAFKEVLKLYD